MKSEMKCDDDDQNSLTKEERKQKKEERRQKKKERLQDKQNSTDVEQPCEDAAKSTSLDVVTESSKKRNKRKKHNSVSVDDEIDSDRETGDHSRHGNGKIKRQKTEDVEQTASTSCDSSLVEIKSNKTQKKDKIIAIDSSYDTNQLPAISQDITQPTKKKEKKHKKSKAQSADVENVMPAKIDSTLLQMDSDINHKKKSKKQNQKVHQGTNEEIDDTKHTDSKENHSSPPKEQHSKKKKKKHSKHKDCESTDETDSNISRRENKKKSKSASCISGNDEVQGNTDGHDSVAAQDMKHIASDLNISNTGDEQRSKRHKKQKNRSKNSPTASMVMNSNGKEELCRETSACGRPTSDQMIKSEQGPACAAPAHGNWQGNLFESGERQNKFLRLLGGMKKSNETENSKASATLAGTKKKGLFGSLASLSSTASSGSSAALDVNAAASLNQKLEDEYNKAMNFKLSGKVGTGFGFVPDPAKGKTFHIDVNKSKSMKFADD